jgi:hypothetical protein
MVKYFGSREICESVTSSYNWLDNRLRSLGYDVERNICALSENEQLLHEWHNRVTRGADLEFRNDASSLRKASPFLLHFNKTAPLPLYDKNNVEGSNRHYSSHAIHQV